MQLGGQNQRWGTGEAGDIGQFIISQGEVNKKRLFFSPPSVCSFRRDS